MRSIRFIVIVLMVIAIWLFGNITHVVKGNAEMVVIKWQIEEGGTRIPLKFASVEE